MTHQTEVERLAEIIQEIDPKYWLDGSEYDTPQVRRGYEMIAKGIINSGYVRKDSLEEDV